jgi:acyl carrier protein phosphodiesterase
MNKYEKEIYNRMREDLCLRTNVVNIKKAQNREEELFDLGEYLPNLLRSFLSLSYYTKMREMGVIEEVLEQMAKTRKQGREKDIYEFVKWIDKHQDFDDLLNRKKFEELDEQLKALEDIYK